MKFKILVGIAALTLLAACSSNDEKKQAMKPASLVEFDATIKMKKLWSKSVGEGFDKRYARFSPAITADAIYASDVEGRVFALNKETGKRKWRKHLADVSLSAGVGAGDGKLFVGTYDGELIALNAATGDTLWQAKASSEILSVPATNGDVVVAQTINGRLYAFDAETGEQRWRYDHTVPALTIRGLADPVITRTQVVAAFGNGQIVSLSPEDGASQWSGRVSQPKGVNELEKIVDIDGTPQISGGYVFAATYQGAIATFSKAKGQSIWKQDFSTFNNLAAGQSKVIGVTEESHLVAFNSGSGTIDWTNDALHRRDLSGPVIIDDYVVAIDDDDHLHVMSLADGTFAYRFKPSGDGFTATPRVHEGKIFVLSDDGQLSAYFIVQ